LSRNWVASLLKELFQLDQPDLDFGLYRIMHAKSTEATQFLDKDLLPQVKEAFGLYKTADKAELEKELARAIEQAQALGADPETLPKVKDLRARLKSDAVDVDALENEVYDHLFSFFRRYYSEGDFLAKRVYKPGVYAIPYEGEEIKLLVERTLPRVLDAECRGDNQHLAQGFLRPGLQDHAADRRVHRQMRQLAAMIPDGSPVAWFPPRMGDFFKKQGIDKVATRLTGEALEKELEGFRKLSWGIDLPKVEFATYAQAIATLENDEPLLEINAMQIDASRDDVESQHVSLIINNLVKQ